MQALRRSRSVTVIGLAAQAVDESAAGAAALASGATTAVATAARTRRRSGLIGTPRDRCGRVDKVGIGSRKGILNGRERGG